MLLYLIIIGVPTRPQLLPPTVSERDVGEEECVVNVEWSEAFVSCGGSLSQYVLSVTPPTPDCQSESGNCSLTTNETQLNLTMSSNTSYSVTVRGDTCRNDVQGPESDSISLYFNSEWTRFGV